MSEEQAGMLAVLELGPVATDLRGHNSVDLARASGLPTTTARKAKQDVSFWQGGGDLLARSTGKGGAGKVEADGRRRAGGVFCNALSRVDSAFGNGTEASPRRLRRRRATVGGRARGFSKKCRFTKGHVHCRNSNLA
jgi:hypothetical protein